MANDRLYLRCGGCNSTRPLMKFWGGGEFGPLFPQPNHRPGDPDDDGTRMNAAREWMLEHLRDCRNAFGNDLGTDPGIAIVTEDQLDARQAEGE